MKEIILRVNKPVCKTSCPLPLEVIPAIEKNVHSVKTVAGGKVRIRFDEKKINRTKIIKKIKGMGYEVKE